MVYLLRKSYFIIRYVFNCNNQSFFLPKYPNTSFRHITAGINANIPNAMYGSTDDFGYGYGM